LVALAGFGVLAAVPFTMGAIGDGTGLNRGAKVVPTKQTPAVVKTALHSSGPVVVAFLLPGITEDEIVQKRLDRLQRSGGFRDTKFIVYRITGKTKLGDLPAMFAIKYTPAVAVIQGDDKLSNVWRGLVDEDIIAQSLIDARNAVPHALKVTPRKGKPSGNPAGIALAKKVNAAYAKVPGVSIKATGRLGQVRLVDGRERVFSATISSAGKTVAVVGNPTGLYSQANGARCWTRSTNPKDIAGLGEKMIALQGVEFGKPVTSKDGKTKTLVAKDLLKQNGGGQVTYTIDAASSRIRSGNTVTYTTLAKAPVMPKPDIIC
jgi:hypothetical protein